jgi:ATP-binding cassette subfamily F protein 3
MEKVEAKLKQKLEKRENPGVTSSANTNYATYDSSKNASASQSISRKAESQKDSDTNRSFDITIENFDVSFGNK